MSIDIRTDVNQIFSDSEAWLEANRLALLEEEKDFEYWYWLSGYHPDFIDAFCHFQSGEAAWEVCCFPSDVYGDERACPGLKCATCYRRPLTWDTLVELLAEMIDETDPLYQEIELSFEERVALVRNPRFSLNQPNQRKKLREGRCRKQRQAVLEGALPTPPAYMTPRTEKQRVALIQCSKMRKRKSQDWLEAQIEASLFEVALVEVRFNGTDYYSVSPEYIDEFFYTLPLQFDRCKGVEYVEVPEHQMEIYF